MISLRECFFFPPLPRFPTNSSSCFSSSLPGDRTTTDNPATRDRNEGKKWLAFKAFSTDATLASNERPLAPFFSLPSYRILLNLKYDSIFIRHNFLEEVIYFWKWSRLSHSFFEKNTLFSRNQFFLYRIIHQHSSNFTEKMKEDILWDYFNCLKLLSYIVITCIWIE